MRLTTITAAAAEPLAVRDAAAHLRILDQSQDELLASLVAVARDYVEQRLNRRLITQTVDCWLDRLRAPLVLPFSPVQSVIGVYYLDADGAEQTLASDLYSVIERYGDRVIVPSHLATWPTPRDVPEAVRVRAVYGYGDAQGDLPPNVAHALRLVVAELYAESRETTDVNVSAEVRRNAFAVHQLLEPYRLYRYLETQQ